MNWAGGSPQQLGNPHIHPSDVMSAGYASRVEFLLCMNARRRYHEHHRNVPNHKRLQLTDPALQRIAEFLPKTHTMAPILGRDFVEHQPPLPYAHDGVGMRGGYYSPSRRSPEIPQRSPYITAAGPTVASTLPPRAIVPMYEPTMVGTMLFPERFSDTRTKWAFTIPRILLGVMCFLFFVMQVVLMDLYIYRHYSNNYLGLIAWDAVAGAFLAFALFMPSILAPGRGVDLMRWSWVLVMGNQVTKMCILYGTITSLVFNEWKTFDTFNGLSSLNFTCYLSVIIHGGLLYWCTGLANPYEHTHSMAGTTYLLSIIDLMDGINLWEYYQSSSLITFDTNVDNAIRIFFSFAAVVSPFCAYVAVAEANTTERVWRRLAEWCELHVLISFLMINLPVLIFRLYMYFTYYLAPTSVFIAKEFLIVVLVVFNPCAIRAAGAHLPTQI